MLSPEQDRVNVHALHLVLMSLISAKAPLKNVFKILFPKQNSLSRGIKEPLAQICLCLLLLLFTQLRGTSVVVSNGYIPIKGNLN